MLLLLLALMCLRWGALRCHDCDRSGWWVLLTLVPYLNFLAQLVILFLPGTDGDNDHGAPPRSGSWPKFGLSALAVGLSLALVASSPWENLLLLGAQATQESSDEPLEVPAMLRSAAGRAAFSGPYAEAAPHKAFAASPSGAWGWKSGPSIRTVVQEAMATCEANREAYTAPCELVNVNGQAVTMRRN